MNAGAIGRGVCVLACFVAALAACVGDSTCIRLSDCGSTEACVNGSCVPTGPVDAGFDTDGATTNDAATGIDTGTSSATDSGTSDDLDAEASTDALANDADATLDGGDGGDSSTN